MDVSVKNALVDYQNSLEGSWEQAYFAGWIQGATNGEFGERFAFAQKENFDSGFLDGIQYFRLTRLANEAETVRRMKVAG